MIQPVTRNSTDISKKKFCCRKNKTFDRKLTETDADLEFNSCDAASGECSELSDANTSREVGIAAQTLGDTL